MLEDINPETFLPSSRSVAFSRGAFTCSGGYPEWLDYSEDLLFDFALIDCCGGFAWAPDAVAHFRPRPTLRKFARQYYLYARGDGKADLWRKRHLIRYLTYLVALPILLALAVLHHPAWLLLLAGRRAGLLLAALGTAARPVGRLLSGAAAVGGAADPRHPRHRRRSQDVWLPCGPALAARQPSAAGNPLAQQA